MRILFLCVAFLFLSGRLLAQLPDPLPVQAPSSKEAAVAAIAQASDVGDLARPGAQTLAALVADVQPRWKAIEKRHATDLPWGPNEPDLTFWQRRLTAGDLIASGLSRASAAVVKIVARLEAADRRVVNAACFLAADLFDDAVAEASAARADYEAAGNELLWQLFDFDVNVGRNIGWLEKCYADHP